jgi:hypothetical protein
VSANQPILVERTVFANQTVAGLSVSGDSNAVAVAAPRTMWSFAEGTTLPGFQTYFTVSNPSPQDTVVSVTYGIEGGGVMTAQKALPAMSRVTIDANSTTEGVGPGVTGFSTVLSATVAVLAERPVFFNHVFAFATGNVAVDGASDAFGTAPANAWYAGEGNVLPDFDEFLTLGNPGTTPANVTINYTLEGLPGLSRSVTVPAQSRLTVPVFDASAPGGIGRGVSNPVSEGVGLGVISPVPIVVERAMYFARVIDPGIPEIFDGDATAAYPGFEKVWYYAEGTGLPDFRTFLTLSNPQAQDAHVSITYFPDDSSGPVTKTTTVGAGQRLTIQTYNPRDPAAYAAGKTGFATKVASDIPILSERPEYEDHAFPEIGEVNGGDIALGLPNSCGATFAA